MACWSPADLHLPPLKHFMWFPDLPFLTPPPPLFTEGERKDIVGKCTRIYGNSQLMDEIKWTTLCHTHLSDVLLATLVDIKYRCVVMTNTPQCCWGLSTLFSFFSCYKTVKLFSWWWRQSLLMETSRNKKKARKVALHFSIIAMQAAPRKLILPLPENCPAFVSPPARENCVMVANLSVSFMQIHCVKDKRL